MGRKSSVDMTQGPILRLILTFSIPLLLGNLFQELYLVVDSRICFRSYIWWWTA